MELTFIEQKTIARLRKQQRYRPIGRWLALGNKIGFGILLACILRFEIQRLLDLSHSTDDLLSMLDGLKSEDAVKSIGVALTVSRGTALEFAWFFPIWVMLATVTLISLIKVVTHWRGHTKDSLLLKLVDAQQGQEANKIVEQKETSP